MQSRTLLCKVSDIPQDGMKQFELDSGSKVLVLRSGGECFAYDAICPHQEVELCEGFYDGCVLTCHQHLWQWDAKSGDMMGLAEAPLVTVDIDVEDGEIYVYEPGARQAAAGGR
jgi:toluene monooxygenase system ferredoxin subunit